MYAVTIQACGSLHVCPLPVSDNRTYNACALCLWTLWLNPMTSLEKSEIHVLYGHMRGPEELRLNGFFFKGAANNCQNKSHTFTLFQRSIHTIGTWLQLAALGGSLYIHHVHTHTRTHVCSLSLMHAHIHVSLL